MAVTFNGRDIVTNFKETSLNGAERQYQVEYVCRFNTVTHYVDQANYQYQDADTELRTYRDVLTYEENRAAGLTRSPTVRLRTQNARGTWSAWVEVAANNPIPVLVGTPVIERSLTGIQIRVVLPSDSDLAGFVVWIGDESGFAMDDAHEVYRGSASNIDVSLATDRSYYMRIAPYDAFGLDLRSAWDEMEVKRRPLGDEIVGTAPWGQLPDLVGNILQKPIDDITALHLDYNTIVLRKSVALADGNAVAIRDLKTYVDDKGGIVAEDLLQLTSRVGDAEAGLLQFSQTYANDKEAMSSSLTDLIAKVGTNEAGFVRFTEQYATDKKATSSTLTQLRTDVNGNKTAVEDSVKAFSDFKTATVDRFTGIETEVGDANTKISTLEKTVNDGETATSGRINELGAKIETEASTREAAVKEVDDARIEGDSVLAGQIQTISSELNTPDTGIKAVLESNRQTQINDNGARVQDIQGLQSTVGGYSASIEEAKTSVATLNGKLQNAWTIKAQQIINGVIYTAGGGLVMEDGVSAIAWTGDSFRISTGQDSRQVFYADGNGVFLDVATIRDASISTLKLPGGAVTIKHVLTAGDTYVAANTAVNVFETGWLTIGDGVFGTATVDVEFTLDGTLAYDTACRFFLFVDTGAGWIQAKSKTLGISTDSGNTYFRMDGSLSHIVDGPAVRVALRANPAAWLPDSVARNVWVRDIGISVDGAKR